MKLKLLNLCLVISILPSCVGIEVNGINIIDNVIKDKITENVKGKIVDNVIKDKIIDNVKGEIIENVKDKIVDNAIKDKIIDNVIKKEINEQNYKDFKEIKIDNIISRYVEANNNVIIDKDYKTDNLDYDYDDNPKVSIIETIVGANDWKISKVKFNNLKLGSQLNKNNNEHPQNVLDSFLDVNNNLKVDDDEKNLNIDLTLYSRDYINIKNIIGITNHSYGWIDYMDKMYKYNKYNEYNDKIVREYRYKDDFYTPLIHNSAEYKHNKTLRIASLSNNSKGTNTKYFAKSFVEGYDNASPEVKKMLRSETIFVKNQFIEKYIYKNPMVKLFKDFEKVTTLENKEKVYEDIKYFYINNRNNIEQEYKPIALSLRSHVVGHDGYINITDNTIVTGSSYSAPRVSRLAYDIKKKFPFLSLGQVKQIILTTADHVDNGGYLDNFSGWGQVNRERALKGPNNFNAGLIDEMKFFKGNYDKIFDKDGNRYFYVNIPINMVSVFENDITSGLKGDGNTTKSTTIAILGKILNKSERQVFRHRIPNVLDDEKLYYANIATAGLRKNGKGELILLGKQLYTSKTQIFDGTLTLKNYSKSHYEVGNLAKLNIDGNKEININIIHNSGIVNFNVNSNIGEYKSSKKSITNINQNIKLKVKSFESNGKINFNFNGNKKIDLDKVIISENPILIDIKTDNIFLNPILINNNKIVKLEFINGSKTGKKLKDLSESELRNIASYDINTRKFFEEYGDIKIAEQNLLLSKSEVALINAKAIDKANAKEQIFTDNYSNFISSLFEGNLEVQNIKLNNLLYNIYDKKNKISFGTFIDINVLDNDKSSKLKKILNSTYFSYGKNISKNINLNLYGVYTHSNYNFDKVKSEFINNNVEFGIVYTHNFKSLDIIIDNSLSYNNTKISREIIDEKVKNKLHSLMFQNKLLFKRDFKIDKIKTIFTPFISNTLQVLNVFESARENSSLGVKILKNIFINDKIGFGIATKTTIFDKITINNRLKLDINTNINNTLKVNILDKDTVFQGEKLSRMVLDYQIGVSFIPINNLKLGINANINTKSKFGANIFLDYEF
ncbi:S8 family serine peptidase [Oceanivirga salmonicida]|uniref:S8 family serine peptidase n=1 Tax=Oceanivirga salmonicida TaxID=1769291 RepID=UPI0008323343|nr:S8 family serine peptidase [Oceanivirga salmonicida]